MTRCNIGIFYPADPIGQIPGGIDTIIRSIMEQAPEDLTYTLFGATSDANARPVGRKISIADGRSHFVPLIRADPAAVRKLVPLSLRYFFELRQYLRAGRLREVDILDFHRIDPTIALFAHDPRPKNVMIHQDMTILRNKDCDIGWRHAPWLYERMERTFFPQLDRIVCVRESAIERYRRMFPDIADRFAFLPTWVDATVFHPATSQGERQAARDYISSKCDVPPPAKLLVFVGRLDRQKDPLLLVEAMRLVCKAEPQICVLLIGDGSLRHAVESRIDALNLRSHFRILGACAPVFVAEVLRAADLFVMSSAYEGMPIAVLEALASGVPVVTTDVGEVARVVRNGCNGEIVAVRTPEALADGVQNVLLHLDALRGAPCRQAVAPYSPERALSQIFEHHRGQAARRGLKRAGAT